MRRGAFVNSTDLHFFLLACKDTFVSAEIRRQTQPHSEADCRVRFSGSRNPSTSKRILLKQWQTFRTHQACRSFLAPWTFHGTICGPLAMDSRSGVLITHRALQRFQPLPRQLDEDGRKASLEDPLHRRRMESQQGQQLIPTTHGSVGRGRRTRRRTPERRTGNLEWFASGTASPDSTG